MTRFPLPQIAKTDDPRWPYRLRESWRLPLPPSLRDAIASLSSGGYAFDGWVQAVDDFYEGMGLLISEGYSFDGCSCWPDGHRLPACLLHDALRQAVTEDPCCPWTRAEADRAFDWALGQCGVNPIERIAMVRAVSGPLGWLYSLARRQKAVRRCRECPAGTCRKTSQI